MRVRGAVLEKFAVVDHDVRMASLVSSTVMRARTTQPATKIPTIVVAGTSSGVGKTTIAVGLMHTLRQSGLRVQPFKVLVRVRVRVS